MTESRLNLISYLPRTLERWIFWTTFEKTRALIAIVNAHVWFSISKAKDICKMLTFFLTNSVSADVATLQVLIEAHFSVSWIHDWLVACSLKLNVLMPFVYCLLNRRKCLILLFPKSFAFGLTFYESGTKESRTLTCRKLTKKKGENHITFVKAETPEIPRICSQRLQNSKQNW